MAIRSCWTAPEPAEAAPDSACRCATAPVCLGRIATENRGVNWHSVTACGLAQRRHHQSSLPGTGGDAVTSSEVPQVSDTDLGVRGERVSGGPLQAQAAIVLDRVVGCCGELVLQRRDGHYEIVANGVFLMDTRDRGSERLHVTAAADCMPQPGRMLIGGLGVGASLAAALAHHGVGEVDVVEREPAVLRWNGGPLAAVNGDALRDPRVHTHEADVVQWLAQAPTCAL